MNILIACERSQVICKAFRKQGHNAFSCDIAPCDGDRPEWHYHCDVRELLTVKFDLVIFHPECRYITNSGVRWFYPVEKNFARWHELKKACHFFNLRKKFNAEKVATENPIPHKYAVQKIGFYDQLIQPWQFGDPKFKATCFWLKNLPPLKHTNVLTPPTDPEERKRWAEVHRASPGPDRSRLRSVSYPGIAAAMADQWGSL